MTHKSSTERSTSRLFIALWPDKNVQQAIQRWRDSWSWSPEATLTRVHDMHLTLHFLGNVPNHRIAELSELIKTEIKSFELCFGCNELWSHGVAVLEPMTIPPALSELHNALKHKLQAFGMPPETRPYRPHITLARHAGRAKVPKPDKIPGELIRWQVSGYALNKSSNGYSTLLQVP